MTGASDEWLNDLRSRFLTIARRRVPEHVAEDVVQETLGILVEKGLREPGDVAPEGTPVLAFGFRVLRNVIGNYYQHDRVRRERLAPEAAAVSAADPAPTPFEALASGEAVRMVREELETMGASDGPCARYLEQLLNGLTPRELARQEGLKEAVLYRRVYRCRIKLRDLLEKRGIVV